MNCIIEWYLIEVEIEILNDARVRNKSKSEANYIDLDLEVKRQIFR